MAKKTNDSDNKILELIKEINRQKKEIASAEKPQYITNCNFSYSENGSNVTNIHVESNVGNLIKIVAFLSSQGKCYDEAATTLGVESPPAFTWAGFTVKDWTSDIKMRLMKVQIASKRKKLETLEARLNGIISPELRAKMELEAIESELK